MLFYIVFSYIVMLGVMANYPLNIFEYIVSPLTFPYYLGKFITGRKL